MHPSFLPILCCPRTGSALKLVAEQTSAKGMVQEGWLESEQGDRYPIIRGVPRFVGKEMYAASFGYEWTRWPRLQFEDQNVGKPMAGHTTRMWQRITEASAQEVQGRTIVEFGCGPGRFLDVVRHKGGRAVGIDLSLAVDSARKNFADDPEVLIVQGDVLNPPFRVGAFDGGYTIGVLHHSPDPGKGLVSLAKVVRPGGWIACCVYPKGEFYDYPSVLRFRRIHNAVKPYLGYWPALIYSYLSAYFITPALGLMCLLPVLRTVSLFVQKQFLVTLGLPDWQWRVLDIFDAITPHWASTHTGPELVEWFARANCNEVRATDWCVTSYRGVRP